MRIKLSLRGKVYTSSVEDLVNMTIGQCRTIKRETGMTIAELKTELLKFKTDENPDILAVLVYLLQSRAGEHVSWSDLDSVPLQELAAGLSVEDDTVTATGDVSLETPAEPVLSA